MKSFINKIILGTLALGAFSIMAPVSASAAGSLNPDITPWGTGVTSVAIVPTDTMGKTDSVSAQPGDTVAVNIYYHNQGDQAISNVILRMSKPSGSASTFTFNGSVSGNGVSSVGDTATVRISSSQTLTFIPGSVRWFPNQSAGTSSSGQTISSSQENALVGGSGFNIGTLTPGWSSQGGIVAHFKVGSTTPGPNPNPQGVLPNVATGNYSGFNSGAGNVTLNGVYNSNGYSTTTAFQYRVNGGSWTTACSTNRGITQGSFSCPLSNLATGSYEYKATATNSNGTAEGSIISFSISRTNTPINCPTGTHNVNNVCVPDTQSCPTGTFSWNGSCIQNCPTGTQWNGTSCAQTYVPPVQCSTGYYYSTTHGTCIQQTCSPGFTLNSNGVCVQQYVNCPTGTHNNGNGVCVQDQIYCSNGYHEVNGTCVQDYIQTQSRPSVSTLGTISVGGRAAAVDGYYNSNGCSVSTWFKYGTTQSLGNTTNEVNRSTGSGSIAQALTDISPNTTYYYQAAARNCVGTSVGSIRSFTTSNDTSKDPVIIKTDPVVYTGGTGNSFVKLAITNNRETVRSGKEGEYEVSWENISGRDLKDIVLEINFPEQVKVLDTDYGSIKRDGHSVVYKINDLAKKETGSMTITTESPSGLRSGDPVVAQAIAAFENPKTGSAENAIAYDADEYSTASGDGSVLGASLFGVDFLPTSLAGWLLILLLLTLLIIIAHAYISRRNNGNGNYPQGYSSAPMYPVNPGAPAAHAPVASAPVASAPTYPTYGSAVPENIPTESSPEYIPYRPTPKQ